MITQSKKRRNQFAGRLVCLMLILLLPLLSAAESNPVAAKSSGTIKGIILARGSNQSVEFANLVLYSTSDSALITGTISAPDGSFELKEIPYGSYYMLIQFIGFNTQIINDIKLSSTNRLYDLGSIYLKETSENLE